MADAKKVGRRLQALRTHLGITQVQFSARLGLVPHVWSEYERGAVLIPVSQAEKAVDELPGLTLDWLYRGRAEGVPQKVRWQVHAASGDDSDEDAA